MVIHISNNFLPQTHFRFIFPMEMEFPDADSQESVALEQAWKILDLSPTSSQDTDSNPDSLPNGVPASFYYEDYDDDDDEEDGDYESDEKENDEDDDVEDEDEDENAEDGDGFDDSIPIFSPPQTPRTRYLAQRDTPTVENSSSTSEDVEEMQPATQFLPHPATHLLPLTFFG